MIRSSQSLIKTVATQQNAPNPSCINKQHKNIDTLLPHLFLPIEEKIQKQVNTGNTIFFSQLINNLEQKTYESIQQDITKKKRLIEEIELGFYKYPCILSLYLTVTISRNISENFAIYPHIETAFNIELNSDTKKKKFWLSFRNACKTIGLDISPRTSGTHFMVNEYLRQCGYPLRSVDILVKRCLLLGNQVGFPDKDDTESLRIWNEDLLRSVNANFPKTALRILENDYDSYYIQKILEVLENRTDHNDYNQFQIKVAEFINAEQISQKQSSKTLDIPRLVFQDGLIGIRLNNPSNTDWSIATDNTATCNLDCTSFTPLDSLLTKSVVVANSKYKREWVFTLWQDDKSNRMLLFHGNDGRFVSQLAFSSEELPEAPLAPGKYILLTKFNPNHPELPSTLIQDDPEIFETPFSIAPGQLLRINRGPAVLTLKADASPLLEFSGNNRSDLEGQEVFMAKGLKISIQLPPDLADEELTLRIRSKTLGESIDLPMHATTSPRRIIDLADHLAGWNPGVSRIVAECRRSLSQRILARTSAVLWNGLDDIELSGKITCSANPTNFDKEKSKNFSQDEQEKTLSIKEFLNKTWSTAFNDNGTILKFVWGRPGLTLRLRTVENGSIVERQIPEGSKLSIQTGSNDLLMIFGLGEGVIKLGNETWRVGHTQKHWKAPLLSLIDRVDHSSNVLMFESSLGVTKELLRFVTPHNADNVKLERTWQHYAISFQQTEHIEGLWLQATNLVTGDISSCYFDTPYSWSTLEHFTLGGEVSALVDGSSCVIKFSPQEWPDGLWAVEMSTRSKNRWGKITNSRLDDHIIVMPIENELFLENPIPQVISMALRHGESLHDITIAVHKHLLCCHSIDTWPHMEWITELWHQLLSRLTDGNKENWDRMKTVMELIDTAVPEDAHPGWIPLVHPAWSFPKLFAFPSALYATKRPEKKHLALCAHNLLLFDNIMHSVSNGDLHQAIALPIKDKINYKGYDVSQLLQIWKYIDIEDERKVLRYQHWRPGLGHYLGPLHLRYAQNALKEVFSQTQVGQGNNQRRSGCVKISNRASNYRCIPEAPIGAKRQIWDDLLLYGQESATDNEKDILHGSIIFLATCAYFCRKAAHFNTDPTHEIESYFNKLIPSSDEKAIARMGAQYLIACGEEVFGFYLMFWELLFQTGLDA
ncbi:MAG: hypothetical protein EOM03_04260 [Clostridia bacterium]|nr:hypothetical protein [Clostridia bacterium]